jgi:hypothetical protein
VLLEEFRALHHGAGYQSRRTGVGVGA